MDWPFPFPQIVSEGTLRPHDLAVAYSDAAKALVDFHADKGIVHRLRLEAIECAADELAVIADSPIIDQGEYELMHEVADALSELANPFGYYFGSHDGDGALFGFWLDDPDDPLADIERLRTIVEAQGREIANLTTQLVQARGEIH